MTTKANCPKCGSTNCYYRKTSDSWRCRRCKESFEVGHDLLDVEHEKEIQTPSSNDVMASESNDKGFWAKLRGLFSSKGN